MTYNDGGFTFYTPPSPQHAARWIMEYAIAAHQGKKMEKKLPHDITERMIKLFVTGGPLSKWACESVDRLPQGVAALRELSALCEIIGVEGMQTCVKNNLINPISTRRTIDELKARFGRPVAPRHPRR